MGFPETARRGLMTPVHATAHRLTRPDRLRRDDGSPYVSSQLPCCHARGAIGTFLRYLVSVLALPISRELPWGTIIINITGSFVIGLFGTLTLASGRFPVSENLRLFVMVGFCGG